MSVDPVDPVRGDLIQGDLIQGDQALKRASHNDLGTVQHSLEKLIDSLIDSFAFLCISPYILSRSLSRDMNQAG